MSDSKPQLARDGTMAVTAKEGKTYLDKNLTDWKKPYLTDHFEEKQSQAARGRSKPKLSKHTTMKGTAKEGEVFLEGKGKPDEDAQTRGQQKKIEEVKGKRAVKRSTTIAKTMQEAKFVLSGTGLETATEGRRTRSASRGETAPPPMKKANTMVRTAKEGKAFLKRGRKPKANKGKEKEEKVEEEDKTENGESEEKIE